MGEFDIPATIDKILEVSGQEKLFYVGKKIIPKKIHYFTLIHKYFRTLYGYHWTPCHV